MLGAAGCLAPELLRGTSWFSAAGLNDALLLTATGAAGAGAVVGGLTSGGDGGAEWWTHPESLVAAAAVSGLAVAEAARGRDYAVAGSMAEPLAPLLLVLPGGGRRVAGGFAGSGTPAYPGGPLFNALSYVASGPGLARYKEAELRHGRLAMLAMLGFAAQAALTGEGPWANLVSHLASPVGANVLTAARSELAADVVAAEHIASDAAVVLVAAGTILGFGMAL